MFLSRLSLQNFRNHRFVQFEFSPGINLISGNNGVGKTNLLESIYVLSCGKSFLDHRLSELILWDQSLATVQGQIEENLLEVQLQKKALSNSISRTFKQNHTIKTRAKYQGILRAVVFKPDDLQLIAGSPNRRRGYLDLVLSNLHWQYHQASVIYQKSLKHRNQLLDLIYQNQAQPDELIFWDQQLLTSAKTIDTYRHQYLNFLNHFFQSHPNSEIKKLLLNYQRSEISPTILKSNYALELRRGSTQSGPHREDWQFTSQIFNVKTPTLSQWASRGQERLAILALKLGEISYISNYFNQHPILLLDDIFSELDEAHRQLVAEICNQHQSFITSAEPNLSSLLPIAKYLAL